MKKTLDFFKTILFNLSHSFRRFTLAIIMAILTVILGVYLNHYPDVLNAVILKRIALVTTIGIPLYLSIKLVLEKTKSKSKLYTTTFYVIGILLQIFSYFILFKDFSFVPISRFVALNIVLYLIFLIIPQIKTNENYEIHVISVIYRFIVTYIYSGIIFLGIMAIFAALRILFSVNIPDKLTLDILFTLAGVFAPMFFLGGVPECDAKYTTDEYPKFFKILVLYIVVPILSIYSLILLSYFAINMNPLKVQRLITNPSNLLVWFTFISVVVIFFTYPLRNVTKFASIFITVFPKIVLLLVTMLVVRIGIRVYYFGFTEPRYYVLIGSVWALAMILYVAFKKNSKNILMPISAATLIFLTIFGPFSCFNASLTSQSGRLSELLKNNGMLNNNVLVKATKDVSSADKESISSIVIYLNDSNKISQVKYIPSTFRLDTFKTDFGFELAYNQTSDKQYFYLTSDSSYSGENISGFSYLLQIPDMNTSNDLNYTDGNYNFKYSQSTKKLTVLNNNVEIYSASISDIAEKIYLANKSSNMTIDKGSDSLPLEKMAYTDDSSNLLVKYEIQNINGYINSASAFTLEYIQLRVFIKIK